MVAALNFFLQLAMMQYTKRGSFQGSGMPWESGQSKGTVCVQRVGLKFMWEPRFKDGRRTCRKNPQGCGRATVGRGSQAYSENQKLKQQKDLKIMYFG